ncbi:MAG: hypothetical protein HY335_06890 [Deinococcus sp.]|nr:hypothetical protein [Deinococcus sp.]
MTTSLQVLLDPAVRDKLEQLAKVRHISPTALVQQAVLDYLTRHYTPLLGENRPMAPGPTLSGCLGTDELDLCDLNVLEVLAGVRHSDPEGGHVSAKGLAKQLGLTLPMAQQRLKQLIAHGCVEKKGSGYRITEHGQAHVEFTGAER